MNICIDFDGTIVEHEFPKIGKPIRGALKTIKKLQEHGHNIILFTMRGDNFLKEAVEYLTQNDVKLFGINTDPTQKNWTSSPKAFGELYIDDSALGCPLIYRPGERSYVNWDKINEYLIKRGILPEEEE